MERYEIDEFNIRPDRISEVARRIRAGQLAVIPTDTTWAIVCDPFQTASAQRLGKLRSRHAGSEEARKRKSTQPMSLLFGDLAPIGHFVVIDQPQYRLLRRILPGPYTVVLPASREVPRLLQSKRKAVGIRIPDHAIARALLRELDQPLLACTARVESGEILVSGTDIEQGLADQVDILLEGAPFLPESSTVIDWTGEQPKLLREGKGAIEEDWEPIA